MILSRDFGDDKDRGRIAKSILPRLLIGGVGGGAGLNVEEVLYVMKLAEPFLAPDERGELNDTVLSVRSGFLKALETSKIDLLDEVAQNLPETLAKIAELVPSEPYPRLSAIATEGLVRYLFSKTVLAGQIPTVSAAEAKAGGTPARKNAWKLGTDERATNELARYFKVIGPIISQFRRALDPGRSTFTEEETQQIEQRDREAFFGARRKVIDILYNIYDAPPERQEKVIAEVCRQTGWGRATLADVFDGLNILPRQNAKFEYKLVTDAEGKSVIVRQPILTPHS